MRDWIRFIACSGEHLTNAALTVMRTAGADTGPWWISGPTPVHPVRAALRSLGTAASAPTHGATAPRRTSPGLLSEID